MYEFIRTENGTTTRVSGADGLAEVNDAMMGPGQRKVRTMSSAGAHHSIEYKDGRTVKLVRVKTTDCGNRWGNGKDVCGREAGHVGPHRTTAQTEAWPFPWLDSEGVAPTLAADSDDPAEWHGTASRFNHLHRFTEDNRARCNRRIQANRTPPVGGKGEWGVFKRTKAEILASDHTGNVYTFCPRCESA
ncbi:hypothetical protein [Streptomyces albidoflavus]|uniref:hypothetical protein n=1 Tax=Streptomyces albidoflavus TaxID=1886 RepID=UPI0004CA3BE8|nr:hypothetical protein [Streptomyces albidoflavus]